MSHRVIHCHQQKVIIQTLLKKINHCGHWGRFKCTIGWFVLPNIWWFCCVCVFALYLNVMIVFIYIYSGLFSINKMTYLFKLWIRISTNTNRTLSCIFYYHLFEAVYQFCLSKCVFSSLKWFTLMLFGFFLLIFSM